MSESRETRIDAVRKALWHHVRLLKDGVLPYEVDEISEEVVDALADTLVERPERPKVFPFDRSHGSLYDRGAADSFYRRPRDPNYGGVGGDSGPHTYAVDPEMRAEYLAGYENNEREGNHD